MGCENMNYVVSKVLIDLYETIENNQVFVDYREKMLDIIKKYMEKQNPVFTIIEQTNLKTSIITKTYYPKGTFKVYIENNDIYATLEIILALIITKNKGIFVVEENVPLINALTKIANTLIDQNNFKINDNIYFFDVILCVGSKSYYDEILNISYKEIIYVGFGPSDIFISETCENKENKVKEKDAIIYKDMSLAEAIMKMNELGSNFISSIFTKNENEVSLFLEKCNSKNVYINMLPSKKCYLDLDLNLFVKIKNIVISK